MPGLEWVDGRSCDRGKERRFMMARCMDREGYMDATIVGCERGQCGEAFCSVNPAVSERQSGPNGWWRSRCDCSEKAEMMHTEGKFGWRGREEERREEKRGRGDKSQGDWPTCRW